MPTLNWIGKEKVINHHMDVPFRVLEHAYGFTEKGEQKEFTGSGNRIIHGDNLEALKALLPEYEGKIKCIYIDPPYNTGNEGWVYNDNVNDPRILKWLHETLQVTEDGGDASVKADDLTRHDKWLCMMYPRLKLMHKLLAPDGAIFISINEDEQASLKLIMDEIFGPGNYLTMFTIKLRHEERILKGDKAFHEVTEQLYLYRKTPQFRPYKKQRDNTSIDEYRYEIEITDDHPEIQSMDGKNVKRYEASQYKIIKGEPGYDKLKKINIRGTLKEGNSSGRFYMKHLDGLTASHAGSLFAVPDMGDDGTDQRFFLVPANEKRANGDYFQGVPLNRADVKEIPYPNYFDFTDAFNRVGYEGGVDFRFGKKPIDFLHRVFEIAGLTHLRDAVILDAFGGSGSTGEAVLEFNRKFPGNRKFILIERMDYVHDITARRIQNVISASGSGGFDFYNVGPKLFTSDGNLNELAGRSNINRYIWFSETRQPFSKPDSHNEYLLGLFNDTVYYFIYDEDNTTTLDYSFLSTMDPGFRGNQYIIYADNCLLPAEFTQRKNIIFKKIPRDITRF